MKNSLYLLILLVFSACSIAQKEPVWVNASPSDNAYYSAIVKLSKKTPNYVELARHNALQDISTQISVQIETKVAVNAKELNGIPSSEIINQIRTSSRNQLSNVQLVGSYQTDNDYWAYYRLSKSEYLAFRQKQRDQAMQQAISLLNEFDAATYDIAPGITALLKALELIVDFADMDLSFNLNGQKANLYNELQGRLLRLPENLKPQFLTQEINITAMQRSKHNIPVKLTYNKGPESFSCKAFPLVFSFRSGSGDIVGKTLTDNVADAELIIRRISDVSDPQYIELRPDKDYWLARLENPVVTKMVESLQFPPVTLKLNVSHPKAYLDYSFDNTPGSTYKDILVKKLQDLDLEVVTDSAKSDYTFKVIIISRDGEYVPRLNLYSASADAYVELLHTQGYKSIYNNNLTNIKSTASSAEAAVKMSELYAVTEICDKLMYMLVEQYIMK